MKNVTFLIADGVLKPSGLFSAIEVFEKANQFYEKQGKPPFYNIQLAGKDLRQKLLNGSFQLNIMPLDAIGKTDLILFPSFDHQHDFGIQTSGDMLDWVTRQYHQGTELASLCTGTFLLAATGLLKGMPCATHWQAADHFRELFPGLDLQTSKVITEHQGLYTAGGGNSSLNLVLYLVEKYSGRETALYCSKVLQIDIDRTSQSPFILFEGLKDHKDPAIRNVQEYIEQHVSERLTVEQLATHCFMDRINFSRRFKKATQLSPADYIQRIKVEAAKRSFESTGKQINEVMYDVGYGDVKAFRQTFKKIVGMTPGDYRSKFNKAV